MSPMSAAAMNAVDRTKAGVAGGILSMSRMVGGTLGIAVLGALVGNPRAPEAYVDALGHGLLIGAIVAAVGALVAWTLVSPKLTDQDAPVVPAPARRSRRPRKRRASRSARRRQAYRRPDREVVNPGRRREDHPDQAEPHWIQGRTRCPGR